MNLHLKLVPFLIIFICILMHEPHLSAQTAQKPQFYTQGDTSKGLFFELENLNFFSNNEYNSDLIQGYTMMGTWANGSIKYRPHDKISLEGGVQFRRFFGADSIAKRSPFFIRLKFNPLSDLSIIFGELDHDHFWSMPRQMMDIQRLYANSREEGLQIKYSGQGFFKGETWVNWERMIYKNSPFREQLTAGLTGNFLLYHKNHISLRIPINYIAKHWGGEIDIAPKLAETLSNSSLGLDLQKTFQQHNLKRLGLLINAFTYNRSTHSDFTPYTKGSAIHTSLHAQIKKSYISLGYWNSQSYSAYNGDIIYFNHLDGITYPNRSMIDGSFNWDYTWSDNLYFSFRTHFYYDLNAKSIDLRAGIILHLKESFRLKAFD